MFEIRDVSLNFNIFS